MKRSSPERAIVAYSKVLEGFVERCLACEADLERRASQSGGYGGQAVLVLPTSPRRLKLQQATSQAVLEKWGWSAGVFEYCAKSELHPADRKSVV